ncbi:hypothetical protein SS1G_11620 [Sclerotinia sclerotiorum 1980 UF-70]|uniref:Uncharacterized protein n=2 Tax=Sclerotinia sclerotiorum (strain ATCC 18683 / 1980 / Ss-1) TaxID=665079 RepID=A0A1D9Q8T4_SCLS1|nr:hypothetical protein SS1G_11620 [Sclerotinia sclerotiorum 1980 UF-70]APA11370.1 hypothetical protein sscle_07g061400 [Sclerotinia sclerotiorum 1980 UF-70]EDN95741.1 hypothetical protein SS1G_11620 [Sclerotinia sclerotiorum 1980 UF-70]
MDIRTEYKKTIGHTEPQFETLRLYHPLLIFTKSTGNLPRTVTYRSNQLYLPPDTIILPNLLGIQFHPRYWGSD